MLATGLPFLRTLRAPNWRQAEGKAFNWRAGLLEVVDALLEEEKANLFNTGVEPVDETAILWLTRMERLVREPASARALVVHSRRLPGSCLISPRTWPITVISDGMSAKA